MTTLMDAVRIEAPKRSPVRPASPLDPSWDDGSEIPSLSVRSRTAPAAPSGTDWRWAAAVALERSRMTTVDTVRTTTESRSPERSFEVESRGGYASHCRWPGRLPRRRGADVHGAHARRVARQGSDARYQELAQRFRRAGGLIASAKIGHD